MSGVEIRGFGEGDFLGVLEVYRRTLPPGVDEPSLDGSGLARYVALLGDRVVGFGSAPMESSSGMTILVFPEEQRRGIGSALWRRLEADLLQIKVNRVEPWVREENLIAMSWLIKQGFRPIKLDGPTSLYPAETDLSEFEALPDPVTITTLQSEIEATDGCLEKLFDLINVVRRDYPGSPGAMSWEVFLREQNEPENMKDAYFIAKDGDDYVGLSFLRVRGSDTNLDEPMIIQQCLTGVDPRYRRLGIARALKLKTIAYSRDHGYRRLLTHSDHPAMIALNAQLKFKSGPWRVFEKKLAVSSV